MNRLSRRDLKELIEQQSEICLSMFVPTHRQAGPEMQQDPLQLRNQLREAEQLLLTRPLESMSIAEFLAPIEALLKQQALWQHPEEGLALFRSPEAFRCYQVPFRFKPQVVVGTHFYLKPLLRFLTGEGRFFLLALSHNEVRLLEATRTHVQEINLPDSVPTSLAEAMKEDETGDGLQYHSSASGATIGKGGRRPVLFHGQGADTVDEKKQLLHYFQQIDRGLHALFHEETAPLVLAGVAYLLPIYHKANTYPHLLAEGVQGNPDRVKVSNETLCKQAWPLVEPVLRNEQQASLAQFEENKGTDRASSNLSELVPAAFYGRIDRLFVALDQEQWGSFEQNTSTLHLHEKAEPGDEELLDLVATQTLLHGGTVYTLEQEQMPDRAMLAALYRY
jgi:hypothetical protein